MAESSRRSFLVIAGAGAAAVGTAVALPAASADAAEPRAAEAKGPAHPGPLVAHVKNARTGEVAVFAGEKEVVVHDRDLAQRLARIAHTAR